MIRMVAAGYVASLRQMKNDAVPDWKHEGKRLLGNNYA
jgi:hypothetical protein